MERVKVHAVDSLRSVLRSNIQTGLDKLYASLLVYIIICSFASFWSTEVVQNDFIKTLWV